MGSVVIVEERSLSVYSDAAVEIIGTLAAALSESRSMVSTSTETRLSVSLSVSSDRSWSVEC